MAQAGDVEMTTLGPVAAATKPAEVKEGPKAVAEPYKKNPEEAANWFQWLIFWYMTPLMRLGHSRTLEPHDLWHARAADKAVFLNGRMAQLWKEECSRPKPSLLRAAIRLVKWNFTGMFIIEFLFRSMFIINPLLLQQLVLWISTPNAPTYQGYVWAVLLFVSSVMSSVCSAHSFHQVVRSWIRVRSALATLVYQKVVRRRLAVRSTASDGTNTGDASSGDTLQLMETDADKVGQMMSGFSQATLVPLQIAVIIGLLFQTLGPSTLLGLLVMIVALPLMGVIMGVTMMLEKKRLALAGERIKLQSEILQSIRIVKFYAWEYSFMDKIEGVRIRELTQLRTTNMVRSCIIILFLLLPLGVSLATFGLFVALGNTLVAADVFRAVALFNALRFPLISLPTSLTALLNGSVSAGRIQRFLAEQDVDDASGQDTSSNDGAPPVVIRNGVFTYDVRNPDARPILKDINIEIRKGSLTAVVGPVGSGKSSLLAAMLGELPAVSGSVYLSADRVGYVAQTAWIQNMSLRDNILFGKPYDKDRYDAVLAACALLDDIKILPNGDQTEIGNRGINLSGGQKQRVAIARAVYSDASVMMLDDPLSAVDANVGAHIFSQCVSGDILRGRTRIMVTNQLHVLSQCDYVYVLKDGTIQEHGTFADLMAAGLDFAALITEHGGHGAGGEGTPDSADEAPESTDQAMDAIHVLADTPTLSGDRAAEAAAEEDPEVRERRASTASVSQGGRARTASVARERARAPSTAAQGKAQKAAEAGKLVMEEERATGSISWTVYLKHFKAMGGVGMISAITLSVAISQLAIVCSDYWLAYWTSRTLPGSAEPSNWSDASYFAVYAIEAAFAAAFLGARGVLFAWGGFFASRNHHAALMNGVIHAPSSFFDATPTGRILNRFLKDTETIDAQLPPLLENVWGIGAIIVANMAAIVYTAPWFAIPLAVIVGLLFMIQRYAKSTILSIQRIESVCKSPVVTHFTETLAGVQTIRAFREQQRFVAIAFNRVETNLQAYFLLRLSFRWAVIRIEFLNACGIFLTAVLVAAGKGTLDPGLAGAALNFALASGGMVGFLIIMSTEAEARMNSIERVATYSAIEPEPAWDGDTSMIPQDWPSAGAIQFKEVVMRYRKLLDPALRSFSASVVPQEKIGVVGRTGSGKSTLMLSLFRMYPLDSGSIWIDGVDIGTVPLHALRSKMAIIPQDPVLFSGTVRSNLDPFGQSTDEQLWEVLEQVQLKDTVARTGKGLAAPVEEYGSNFSQGEAQLLCMARALLRHPKILVMDEATSSVDANTDMLLQRMVREKFNHCTILAIAHRLHTIMDSDRVFVLDQGRLVEAGSPAELRTSGGHFASLASSSGIGETSSGAAAGSAPEPSINE